MPHDETNIEQRLRKAIATKAMLTIEEFLAAGDTDEYDWLIPGVLERFDRMIVTGPEGGGKSTLLRQLAIQAAAGHGWFGREPPDASKQLCVVYLDVENSVRQTRRKFRELWPLVADEGVVDLNIVTRPDLDLLNEDDRVSLMEELDFCGKWADDAGFDILVAGPLYKLATGDPVKEETARMVSGMLDRIRHTFGCAIVLEAHTPHPEGARIARVKRPYGASLWMRWPEFGLHLAPDGTLEHWRGPRDERNWPTKLKRGAPWPWMVDDAAPAEAEEWHGPTHCMAAVEGLMAELEAAGNGERSGQQVIDLLKVHGHGFRDVTVRQALERLALNGLLAARTGPRNGRYFRSSKAAQMSTNGDIPAEMVEQW